MAWGLPMVKGVRHSNLQEVLAWFGLGLIYGERSSPINRKDAWHELARGLSRVKEVRLSNCKDIGMDWPGACLW